MRLLAVIGQGLGAKSLRDYEPPSVALADWLTEPEEENTPEDRRMEVLRFLAETGGEAG